MNALLDNPILTPARVAMRPMYGGVNVDTEQDWEPTVSCVGQSLDIAAPATAPRAPATRIGRFSLLRVLGEGGMGRVYVGYDEELDRKVAIKLLRSDAGDARRLVREAQSLARLSHPNVVQVHEAGSDDGSVFVVMELVEGQTLAAWARGGSHSWRESVEVLVQAGRGLEAAHDAGLVHRDFKPDNVLVGDDGRVRVLDFGLVRYSENLEDEFGETEQDIDTQRESNNESKSEDSSESLTLLGSVMGTPAYMAPEQHAGHTCDASADQYAFCVTAYELLFDLLPFGRGRFAQLYAAKREGRVLRPEGDTGVPPALHALLVRGLAPEASARWPSMGELLDKLEQLLQPRVRPRWPLLAGAAALGVIGFALVPRAQPEVCALDTEALHETWNEAGSTALREALAASLPAAATPAERYVGTLADQAAARLDTWAADWSEARQASCRATRVEATQSTHALDRREVCFARQRAEFSAVVKVLSTPDPQLPPRVPAVLDTLPQLDDCSLAALESKAELALDPEQRLAATVAFSQLAEARALLRLGHTQRARMLAEAASKAGELTGHSALELEARALLANLDGREGKHEASIEALRSLALTARSEGLPSLEADLRVQLARSMAGDSGRPMLERWMIEEAAQLVTAIARPQDPREVTLEVARARLAEQAGDYEASIAAREHAHALAEGRLTPSARALLRIGIGTSHYRAGRYDAARSELEACLETAYASWGPWAPQAARIEFNLAMICSDLGDRAAARAHMDAALALDLQLWGADSLELGRDRFASAYLDFGQGETERGCAELEPLLPLYERELGSEHDEVGQLLTGIGMCRLLGDDDQGALAAYERALAIQLAALGPEHYEVGLLHANIAEVYLLRGDLEQATEGFERARSIFAASLDADHPLHAYALRGLGTIWLEQGETGRAVLALERGLALADASNAVELAELKFALARALEASASEADPRVRTLSQAALDTLRDAGSPARAELVATWIAAHDSP